MTKVEALAQHVGEDPDIIDEHDDTFEVHGHHYLVLTDEEADEAVAQRIEEDLWAFRSSFVLSFVSRKNRFDSNPKAEKALEEVQGKLCEDAQPLIRAMIGEHLPEFVREAVSADGRGHFLAGYDGEENEEGDFFIYRVS